MTDTGSIRTLKVLLAKYEQDEQRAGEALASAVTAHQAAQRARAQQELQLASARDAVEAHREKSRVATAASVATDWLRAAHAYKQRLLEAMQLEAQRLDEAHKAERRAQQTCDAARLSLAEAKGRREVVEKRIAAALKAQRDKAEAQAEEEAADRANRR
jgi:hypothetical protein